jgi:hypothetical protein
MSLIRHAGPLLVLLASCAAVKEPHVSPDAPSDPVEEDATVVDDGDAAEPDVPVDTVPDTIADTSLDTIVDTTVDTIADTTFDTIVDTEVDTVVDTTVDTIVDVPGDEGTTGCYGTMFSADFELDDGGFTETPSTSVWEWGTIGTGPPPGTHGKVWATNLSGSYGACDDAFLTSPRIDLSACGGRTLTLSFDTWYEYERVGIYYDGYIVEFWNGASWAKIAPVGGWDHTINIYGCSGIHVSGEEGFAGTSGGWLHKTFTLTLSSYPSTFQFRFVHGSDADGHYDGAFIDSVLITAS